MSAKGAPHECHDHTHKLSRASRARRRADRRRRNRDDLPAHGPPNRRRSEEWVLSEPERILELHRGFAQAGSDIVLTCTFGGTGIRLADGPLADQAAELNRRAAELAREAGGNDVLVAGSLGPTGQLCEPLGLLSHDEAADTYAEQAEALADGGADLLVLETMFCKLEAAAAIEGVRRATDLPFVVAFSFDRGTRTMMGTTIA